MKHEHLTTSNSQASRSFLLVFFVLVSLSVFSEPAINKKNGANYGMPSLESTFFPFGLLSFHAEMGGNDKVMISWATASGTNTSHFIMQRSIDGKEFHDAVLLFTIEDNKNTTMKYRYADHINTAGKAGIVYYRLKMVGLNGECRFSSPITVDTDKIEGLFASN